MSPSIVKTNHEKNKKKIKRQEVDIMREVVSKAVNKNNPIDIAILNDIQGEIDIHKRSLTIRKSANEQSLDFDKYSEAGSQNNKDFGIGYNSLSLRPINNYNKINQLILKPIKIDDSVIQAFDICDMQSIESSQIKKFEKQLAKKSILKKKSMWTPQSHVMKEDKSYLSAMDQNTTRQLKEDESSSRKNTSSKRKKVKPHSPLIKEEKFQAIFNIPFPYNNDQNIQSSIKIKNELMYYHFIIQFYQMLIIVQQKLYCLVQNILIISYNITYYEQIDINQALKL